LSAYEVNVQLLGEEKDKLRTDKLEEKNGAWEIMIFWPIVFMVGIVVVLIVWRPKGKTESWTEMSAEEKYLLANKIFSRDPSNFKDKDSDGVEDELEKGS
jgi:hypothetical protein